MAGATEPRLPPIPPGTRPELAALEAQLVAARGRVSLLYQVLGHSAPVAAGWEQLLTAVRQRTTVPADLRELVILRVAVLNGAAYEFEAHVPHAQAAGVSEAKLAAVREPAVGEAFDAREREVLALTDAMTRDIRVPPALMNALQARWDARGLLELVTTVAAYNMVSRLLVALDIGH